MAKILIINGPNLNTLGKRQVEIYGSQTLEDIKKICEDKSKEAGFQVDFRQTNSEHQIVEWVQSVDKEFDGVIVNAAAYTHTSVAIMDALLSISKPVIEVHLSNLFKRESFRHHSYVSLAAKGMICGFGSYGYVLALDAMKNLIKR